MDMVIQCQGLTKRYGAVEAVRDIDLIVRRGEVVGYLGPNGSGKSTTIKLLANLAKPDLGSISLLGIEAGKAASLLGRVSIVSDRSGLYDRLSGFENLMFFARVLGLRNPKKQVNDILDSFGLHQSADRLVGGYSKGMRRRLDLARALLGKPEVIFLDEPFDGVDLESRSEIIGFLRGLLLELRPAVLMTSHVMADVEELANRIIVLKNGRKVIDESLDLFAKRSQGSLTDIYLKEVSK